VPRGLTLVTSTAGIQPDNGFTIMVDSKAH
jgi:hypothetical protein